MAINRLLLNFLLLGVNLLLRWGTLMDENTATAEVPNPELATVVRDGVHLDHAVLHDLKHVRLIF